MDVTIEIEPEYEDPSTSSSSSPTFSVTTPTLVKTMCKTMSAGGPALCCTLHPVIGCALHVVGEGLGVVNEAVEKNVQEHEEQEKQQKIMEALLRIEIKMDDLQASMTNLLEKVGNQEERLTSLDSRMENLGLEEEPKRKRRHLDPNRKVECFLCGGEFSASNMSKHQAVCAANN